MLRKLNKDELLKLIGSYNDYVMNFRENHDISCEPVSIYEYYDNEYQLDETDDNMYCVNCGCEKEDYESMYCDECFDEEQERLYRYTDDEEQEEIHYEKIGVSVSDITNGIEISVIGDTDILSIYDIEMNINEYSKMELYNITKEVSKNITMYYYENNANLPTLEQVHDMINKTKC